MTPEATLKVEHYDRARGPVLRSHPVSEGTVRRWVKIRGQQAEALRLGARPGSP